MNNFKKLFGVIYFGNRKKHSSFGINYYSIGEKVKILELATYLLHLLVYLNLPIILFKCNLKIFI